jgi:4-amino-4-deoxy-L-arabinose transferase-like glycosyltransferase
LAWHLGGWAVIALGFLTKGPIALAIPVVSLLALLVYRRAKVPGILYAGLFAGLVLFLIMVLPWFLAVFQRVPQSAHYMIFGQAAGHFLGTTIRDRKGIPGYFFGVLGLGFLPWTFLLGWLWRREHWCNLDAKSREGWLLLNIWAIFTFTLFSFSHAKLPAYILPIFPALAVMLAWRFFGDNHAAESVPKIFWKIGAAFCFLLPAIFPLFVFFLLHDQGSVWLDVQTPLILVILALILVRARNWNREKIAAYSVGLALLGFFITIAEFPLFDFNFKSNQPLDQIGRALRANFQPGDAIVCWRELPQGLPFYAGGLISATNRPYFGYMPLDKVPFELPGNRERFSSVYLDDNGLADLLHQNRGTLIVNFETGIPDFEAHHADISLHVLARSSKWTLYSNDHASTPQNSSQPGMPLKAHLP